VTLLMQMVTGLTVVAPATAIPLAPMVVAATNATSASLRLLRAIKRFPLCWVTARSKPKWLRVRADAQSSTRSHRP